MSANDVGGSVAPRVALLGSQGVAREQLRRALLKVGATIALEEDPNTLDADAVLASQPQAVLVALEPSIEDALARLDAVLGNRQLTVIYDEAELAVSREGWDAQRWSRHLRAKLHGHRDVLPPGTEGEPLQSADPGHPQRPAIVEDQALQLHLDQAARQAAAWSNQPPFGASPPLANAATWHQPADALTTDAEHRMPPPSSAPLDLVEHPILDGPGMDQAPPPADASALQPQTPVTRQERLMPSFAHLSLVEDDALIAPVRRAEPAMPPALPPGFGGLNLELVRLDEPTQANVSAQGSEVAGAVLLFAGTGGPDAVRRVLAELPGPLPLPVLVHLRLDGGRHDNLAKQIQRIAPMPVMLARPGMAAHAGHVYVVPDGVAAGAGVDGKIIFVAGTTDVLALLGALPPQRSAVLLLSGADPELAEPVVMLGARGALVSGQSLQGCYDWAAAKALQGRGGSTGTPEALALRLIEHLGG